MAANEQKNKDTPEQFAARAETRLTLDRMLQALVEVEKKAKSDEGRMIADEATERIAALLDKSRVGPLIEVKAIQTELIACEKVIKLILVHPGVDDDDIIDDKP